MNEDHHREREEELELLKQQVEALAGGSKEVGAIMSVGKGITHRMAFMLLVMVKRAPGVVSKATFHSLIYGDRSDGGPEPKIFTVHINRLRDWLKRAGCEGKIVTVWGAGYRADAKLTEWVKDIYQESIKD